MQTLNIRKGKSESINKKMTDNTVVKMTNNDLQKTTQKAKDREKRTPLTAADELRRLGRVSSSYSISGVRPDSLVTNQVLSHE